MGRESKVTHDERVRENVLASTEAAKEIIEAVPSLARGIPWAVIFFWTVRELRKPINMREKDLATAGRLTVATAPFWGILGFLYQGVFGAVTSVIIVALTALIGTMKVKEVQKADIDAEPFPGDAVYYQLDLMDAMYLASFVPVILQSVSGRETETQGLGIL